MGSELKVTFDALVGRRIEHTNGPISITHIHPFRNRIIAKLVRIFRELDCVDELVGVSIENLARSIALVRYHNPVRLRKVCDHLWLAEPRLDAVYSPAPLNLQHFYAVIPVNG